MTQYRVGSSERPLRVAIIGAGPSAFYAAEALFKAEGLRVRVDMFDRLPTPHGLVRGGVAPDHQKIKSVARVYVKIAANPGFRFFGNVTLGVDVQVADLTRLYDHVVYAVGNEGERPLGIPGEDLRGVHSATAFVGWYNGHPDFSDQTFDLHAAEQVAVVGNGNVAVDVIRVLLRDPDELAGTDIADHALAALRRSSVREVTMLGRRGPAQAAFTPKEIEEIGALSGVDLVVAADEVEVDPVTREWLESSAPRAARRIVRYLSDRSRQGEGSERRKARCRFLVSPVEILGEHGQASAVRLQRNELYRDQKGTPRARAVDRFEQVPAQLIFSAIGYRGVPIPGVPFDEALGVIPNREGRVLSVAGGRVVPGQYVVGWAKRGPTGLIGTNGPDAKATVRHLLADAAIAAVPALDADDPERIERLLRERGVEFVTYDDWKRIDQHELERGREKGKVRDKLTTVDAMQQVIEKARCGD